MGEIANKADAAAEFGAGHAQPAADHPASKIGATLEFKLLYSALYHDLCEARFRFWHRFLTALNLLAGSGAVFALGAQHPIVGQAGGLLVALISCVQLVWDFGTTARDHAVLRQKYYGLQSDLQRGASEAEISARMTELFGEEPPAVVGLTGPAHNQAGLSLYGDDFTKV